MAYTERQAKIREWLGRVNPHAGRLFEAAVKLTDHIDLACRGRFVAHAYREICSNLMNQYSSNEREEIKPQLDSLATELAGAGIAVEPASVSASEPAVVSDSTVAIPRALLDRVASVVAIHLATPKGKDRAQAIFRGMALDPKALNLGVSQTADRWFRMYNYFVGCAHNREADDTVMMGDAFEREVAFFEETLLSFAEPAIENLNALDEILAVANS